jgi:hypothetical protein
LTQACKNLFPDINASVPAMTTLRSSLSMYVFFYVITFFSLLVLLTAQKLALIYWHIPAKRTLDLSIVFL